MDQPATERLQKVMAGFGLGSRRALESQIEEGAVLVNGKKAQLGTSVKPGDHIMFRDNDWLVVSETAQHRTLIYNKPEGELTTRADPEGRPTVFDRLPRVAAARWVAIGRLDINTTGLLLLTTDGELANAMMHPSSKVDREYVCRIRGQVSDEQLEKLRQGVVLDDGPARFSDVKRLPGTSGNQWFQVTILEGRNREVRRLWEALGCMVSRLKRVRYGAAQLPKGLRVGARSEITARDHRVLRQDVKLAATAGQLTLQAMKGHRPTRQRRMAQRTEKSSTDRSARPAQRTNRPSAPRTARPVQRTEKPSATGAAGPAQRADRPSGPRAAHPVQRTDKSSAPRAARPVQRTDKSSAPRAARPAQRADRPPATRPARPTAKPGSPAGAGRRPHPRSKKAQR